MAQTDLFMGFHENLDAEPIDHDDDSEMPYDLEMGPFPGGLKTEKKAQKVQPKNQGDDDSDSDPISTDEELDTADKEGPQLSSEDEDSQTSGSVVTSDTASDSSEEDSEDSDEDEDEDDSDEDDEDDEDDSDEDDSDADSEDSDDDEDEESDDLSSSEDSEEDDSDSETDESDDETTTDSSYESDTDTDDDSEDEDSDEEEDEEDDDSEEDDGDKGSDSKDPEAMAQQINYETYEDSNNEEETSFKKTRRALGGNFGNFPQKMSMLDSKGILPILTSAIYKNAMGYLTNMNEPLSSPGFLTSSPKTASNERYYLPSDRLTGRRHF